MISHILSLYLFSQTHFEISGRLRRESGRGDKVDGNI